MGSTPDAGTCMVCGRPRQFKHRHHPMESRTKNKKTREQIARMVARAFGGQGIAAGEDAVRELKEGWYNVAYAVCLDDGREVILKIAPPKDADVLAYERNIMETEVASMRLVCANPRIPAPEVYSFDQTRELCDADYFFMEKIAGENLEYVKDTLPPEAQEAVDFRIGEIVREINSYSGTYFGYPGNPGLRGATWREAFLKIIEAALHDGLRKNVDYGHSYDVLRALVCRHAPALDEVTAPCLVHWDAWDSNFLVKDGQITGILDFERALWGDPLMEVQFRPIYRTSLTGSMRGYGKTVLTHAETQRSHLYLLYLALVMNTECFYRNYDTDLVYNYSKTLLEPAMEWLANH